MFKGSSRRPTSSFELLNCSYFCSRPFAPESPSPSAANLFTLEGSPEAGLAFFVLREFSVMTHRCSFVAGTGSPFSLAAVAREGIRNGSAPVGDAWLFDETVENRMPVNLRYA